MSYGVLAVLGVSLKAVGGIRYPRLSTVLYVGMGWLALTMAIRPLWFQRSCSGLAVAPRRGPCLHGGRCLLRGGARTVRASRVRHVFVLMGTACHFCGPR